MIPPFLPATPLSWSRNLEGLFLADTALLGALDLASYVAFRFSDIRDVNIVEYGTLLGAEISEHRQEQQSQILITTGVNILAQIMKLFPYNFRTFSDFPYKSSLITNKPFYRKFSPIIIGLNDRIFSPGLRVR